jgi:hypothetical protein
LGLAGLALSAPPAAHSSEAPADVSRWIEAAQAHVAEREYWASAAPTGLQAPNRAHGIRSHFGVSGVHLTERSAAGGPPLLALRLASIGRGDARTPVPAASEVRSRQTRVELPRSRGLVEWYENGPDGLEQGFDLAEPPPGAGALTLEIAVRGAEPRQAPDGSLVFDTKRGRPLRYGKLHAFDAAGAELPARFAVGGAGRIALVVADQGARYPITIDPLLEGTHDVELDHTQNAQFGFSVAAGDVNGDGIDDLIVGANLFDGGQTDEGAAYVFLGGASLVDGDESTAATVLQSDQAQAELGQSVAAADVNGDGYDDVLVGAPKYDNGTGQNEEGAAFLFLGSLAGVASGTPATADATFEADDQSAEMARSVASAGDVNGDGYEDIIIGAELYENRPGAPANEGAAFVFHGSATGIAGGSASTADSVIVSNKFASRFGASVASAGDVNEDGYGDVIIGAPTFGDTGQQNEGKAFVFHGGPGGITNSIDASLDADAVLESNVPSAQFGFSVALAGDVNGDGFDDVVVGAPCPGGLSNCTSLQTGAAAVFQGGASGVGDRDLSSGDALLFDQDATGEIGRRVASAGDVNNDGYDEVVAGAPGGVAIDNPGSAHLFFGSSGGAVQTGAVDLSGSTLSSGDQFGWAIAAGDFNGDNSQDLIVGAYSQSLVNVFYAPAPEPAGGALALAAAAALVGLARRRPGG